MRFCLTDRILELTRGERIVAIKAVTRAEEYLSDHFPTFPVLPGVLMLEALAEAAAWLVRDAHGFAQSVILLREAKNVTYKSFVKPGNLLQLEVSCRRLSADSSDFDGVGLCDGREMVKARFGLVHFCLAERWGDAGRAADQRMIAEAESTWSHLWPTVKQSDGGAPVRNSLAV